VYQDISDSSVVGCCGRAVRGADVGGAGLGPGVLHDEGAGEVEDLNGFPGVQDADALTGEGAAETELDATKLDRPVRDVRGCPTLS
jgi:hypothetical protein